MFFFVVFYFYWVLKNKEKNQYAILFIYKKLHILIFSIQ